MTDWALTQPQTPGVTEANAKRLRPGMTLEEARVIVGKRGNSLGGYAAGALSLPGPETWIWINAEVAVAVHCDAAGRIERVNWAPLRFPQTGPLARLRAWLGW
jgi:hypothetical protein